MTVVVVMAVMVVVAVWIALGVVESKAGVTARPVV